MGKQQSKITSNIKTRIAIDALTENIMKCKSNALITQRFVISGSYNVVSGAKQVQYTKLSAQCAQDSQNIADLQQKISNALKQAAKASNQSILAGFGATKSETEMKIDNEVKQTITMKNITEVVNSVNSAQEMIISGDHNIVRNFSQEQTNNLVYDASQKLLNKMKSVQAIENVAEASAVAETKSPITAWLDSIGNTIGGVFEDAATVMYLIIIGVVVVVAYMGKDMLKVFSAHQGIDVNLDDGGYDGYDDGYDDGYYDDGYDDGYDEYQQQYY